MRDMVGAVVVLLVIIGVVVAFFGSCSFSPGGPSAGSATVPSADAEGQLRRTAQAVAFPVREPVVPKGWHANSASTSAVGAGASGDVVVRVGWVTSSGRFVQLSQSGGKAADVLVKELGQAEAPRPDGSVEVGGVTWTSYPGRRDEPAWVTSLDGAVLLITGSAPDAEFRQLATATQKATPLPR
jgi:phage tail tape-measure protein